MHTFLSIENHRKHTLSSHLGGSNWFFKRTHVFAAHKRPPPARPPFLDNYTVPTDTDVPLCQFQRQEPNPSTLLFSTIYAYFHAFSSFSARFSVLRLHLNLGPPLWKKAGGEWVMFCACRRQRTCLNSGNLNLNISSLAQKTNLVQTESEAWSERKRCQFAMPGRVYVTLRGVFGKGPLLAWKVLDWAIWKLGTKKQSCNFVGCCFLPFFLFLFCLLLLFELRESALTSADGWVMCIAINVGTHFTSRRIDIRQPVYMCHCSYSSCVVPGADYR